MNELINEKRIENDNKETSKIMEAIHTQAKWNRLEREHSVMMKKIDNKLKNSKKNKIKEVFINGLADTLLFLITITGITVWGFVFYLMS